MRRVFVNRLFQMGYSKTQANKIYKTILESMKELLKEKRRLHLRGAFTLTIREGKERPLKLFGKREYYVKPVYIWTRAGERIKRELINAGLGRKVKRENGLKG